MPETSASQILAARAREGSSPLLTTPSADLSYQDFDERVTLLARRLVAAGLRRGGRVALLASEFEDAFAGMYAAWRAGGVAVPVNTRLPEASLARVLSKASPSHVLRPRGHEGCGSGEAVPVHPDEDYPLGELDGVEPTRAEELGLILFTSGTTGLPKGVCQRLGALTENARLTAGRLGLRPQDRLFLNTPPFYTSAICHFMTLLFAGGSLVAEPGFRFGESLLTRLAETGCTAFGGAPTHLARIVQPLTEPRRIEGFRLFMSSGDHLPAQVSARARELLPDVALFVVYGISEVSGRLCVLHPSEAEAHPGSVGVPLAGMSVRILDEARRELPPGETGQIYVQGPLVMEGYLDEPQLTADALTAQGFRTGDWGHVDEGGFVYVEGRKDDVFKRGGEKVSLQEVQRALLDLELFSEVAVAAKPDELQGKVPIAFVVPLDPERFSQGVVLRGLRERLPPPSIPCQLVVVDEIPRTGSGKPQLAQLKEVSRKKQ